MGLNTDTLLDPDSVNYKLRSSDAGFPWCRFGMIFGTRDKWNAQTDKIGGSGTFYLESSKFINFIKYKRVVQEYPIDLKSLRSFLGLKRRKRLRRNSIVEH